MGRKLGKPIKGKTYICFTEGTGVSLKDHYEYRQEEKYVKSILKQGSVIENLKIAKDFPDDSERQEYEHYEFNLVGNDEVLTRRCFEKASLL